MENNKQRILNMKHPTDGYTVKKLIDDWFYHELNIDALHLGYIINHGKEEFNLHNKDLETFVKVVISSFVELGAKPVRGGTGTNHYWKVVEDYGIKPDEIAENVMKEYINDTTSKDSDKGYRVWFTRPEVYEEKRPTLLRKLRNKLKVNK